MADGNGRRLTRVDCGAGFDPDLQLAAFVESARSNLRSRGVGGQSKGRAISVRVDPALLAVAGARLGVSSQTEILNAGLALLAGADTFGAWLMDQAGALDADIDVDVSGG